MDLGHDFFLIKFSQERNLLHAFHDGPWFVYNNFVSVQRWEPKFVASQAPVAYTVIWVRLPELRTEYYDAEILHRIGGKIGTLLKVDNCTSTNSRGRYARLYVQVPLDQPLLHHLFIGTHKQVILYEALSLLCTNCGRLGHTSHCPHTPLNKPAASAAVMQNNVQDGEPIPTSPPQSLEQNCEKQEG
ncbi:uncharacterized protein At4g02000-like [Capsicum annuum]|uniref:uncharacterized protein At4g02000-like n=1 Tax=Capsicum annuum TaxID=4072 RepID=UPI0007BF4524|nr:uncharacterized protein At4g02000-like [Capsicum annuum]